MRSPGSLPGFLATSIGFEACKEIADPLELPVLAGVFLLKSSKNANYINKFVPGACIPETIRNQT